MKKVTAIFLEFIMLFTLIACGNADRTPAPGTDAQTELFNPIHESTSDGVLQELGFKLQAPAAAEDVRFFIIEADPKIAQMTFTFGGDEYTYRMSPTNEYKDISGMFYEWQHREKALIKKSNIEADVMWNDGKEGVILWYDVVPGVMYSLSQNTNADYNLLETMANTLYLSLQGDAG